MNLRAVLVCAAAGACSFSGPGTVIPDGDDGVALEAGLVAWYKMESLDNKIVEDSMAGAHAGACTSCPASIQGRIDGGYQFTQPTARIDIPSATRLEAMTGFTVALWLRFDVAPVTPYSCAVNKLWGDDFWNSWQLCYRKVASEGWFFGTKTSLSSMDGFDELVANKPPMAGVWYHAAISWDGARKQLWLDGQLLGEKVTSSVVFDRERITIGADIDNGVQANRFAGSVDDLRIYDRALKPIEIEQLARP